MTPSECSPFMIFISIKVATVCHGKQGGPHCSTMTKTNVVNGTTHHKAVVAQLVLEPAIGIWEAMGLPLSGTQIFSLFHVCVIVEEFVFIIYPQALNLLSLLFSSLNLVLEFVSLCSWKM